MKFTKLSFLIILSLFLFINCSEDGSNPTKTLNGIRHLKNVSGGLVGIDIDYQRGDVQWNFNLEKHTLIVENNLVNAGPEAIHAGLENGIYNFQIEREGDIKTLIINDGVRGVIVLLNVTRLNIDKYGCGRI